MVLILLCFFASGTVSLNQSALCVWWGKTGEIAACKAGVYFFGMLVATGYEMVFKFYLHKYVVFLGCGA